MRVELNVPESVRAPRMWVKHASHTELGEEFSKIRPRAAETDTTPYPQCCLLIEM
jgi:hypothetical protein